MQPLVSVILPNYRHAPFLKERIESILAQTMQDFELIILDDCSPDNSREIIENYRDNRHVSQIICNTENSGSTFRQWKRGLEAASGKYVWIAESDDSAAPDFLASLTGILESTPGAVLAYCGSQIIDSEGREIPGADWDRWPRHEAQRECTLFTPRQFVAGRLLCNNMVYNASMALFRRDAAPELDGRFTSLKFAGDWRFWYETGKNGIVAELHKKLNRFRQHGLKVSNDAMRRGLTYTEGLALVAEMAGWLNLDATARKQLAGRTAKRLQKHPELLKNAGSGIPRLLNSIYQEAAAHPKALSMVYSRDKLAGRLRFNIPTVSLIVSTYNSPEALRASLESVLKQTDMPDQVLVADDGSGPETARVVEEFIKKAPCEVKHVWHEDRGFRLAEIRNKAIAGATGDYIIQIDGDIVLHPEFVADHRRAARPGRFACGSRTLLDAGASEKLKGNPGLHVGPFSKGIFNRKNTLRAPVLGKVTNALTGNRLKYRGCNMAFWRADLIAVNGYDEAYTGWGCEDHDLVARLQNAGVRPLMLRHTALQYHLWHPSSKTAVSFEANNRRLAQTRASGKTRADRGLQIPIQ